MHGANATPATYPITKSQATAELSPPYRPDIDGLRAIAVGSVVLFHAGLLWFRSGYVGVDIFFVISGFLIGGIIYRDTRADRFSFATFYARRARRILPALFLVALATCLFGCLLFSPAELQRTGQSVTYALLGLSNLHFWLRTNYFSPDAHLDPFLMTWSLGVEEQFYLAFPIMMIFVRRWPAKVVFSLLAALTAVSFAASAVLTMRAPVAAFYLLPSRAWELGLGACLAIWRLNGWRGLKGFWVELAASAGLVAVLLSLFVFNEHTPFPGLAASLPVLGAAALIATQASLINRRVLAAMPMVGLGLISYSLYLWHWPLLALAWICSPEPPSTTVLLSMVLVSLGAAVASWRWVERPFRRIAVPEPKVLLNYLAALVACLVLPVGLKVSHGLPKRLDPQVAKIEAMMALGRGDCLAGYGESRPNLSAACLPRDGGPHLALLGDSHAAALGSALRQDASAADFGLEQFTKSSCPPLQDVSPAFPEHPGFTRECAAYTRNAFRRVLAAPEVKKVVLAAYWDSLAETRDDAFVAGGVQHGARLSLDTLRAGLVSTEQKLAGSGKEVVVLGDVPRMTFDPARQAIAELIPARRLLSRLLSPDLDLRSGKVAWRFVIPADGAASRVVVHGASQVAEVRFASLQNALCDPQGCRVGDGALPFYFDAQHLSRAGAEYVLRKLPLIYAREGSATRPDTSRR